MKLNKIDYDVILDKYGYWLTKSLNSGIYSVSTFRMYFGTIKNFLIFLNHKRVWRLNDIELQHLNEFIVFKNKKTKEKYPIKTQRIKSSILKVFFDWAYQNRLSRYNYLLSYKVDALQKDYYYNQKETKHNQSKLAILKKSQIKLLQRSMVDTDDFIEARDNAIVCFLLTAGIYAYELHLITPKVINRKNHILCFTDTDNQTRKVPLDKEIYLKAYENWLEVRKEFLNGNACDYLFFTTKLTPISTRLLYKIVANKLKEANLLLDYQGSDILRQTAITAKMMEGHHYKKIKTMFGIGIRDSLSIEKYQNLCEYYLT